MMHEHSENLGNQVFYMLELHLLDGMIWWISCIMGHPIAEDLNEIVNNCCRSISKSCHVNVNKVYYQRGIFDIN